MLHASRVADRPGGAYPGPATQLPPDVDLVFIEYTATAAHRHIQKVDTPERRALERMIRRLLLLPGRPAVLMFHVWTPQFDEGRELGPCESRPLTKNNQFPQS